MRNQNSNCKGMWSYKQDKQYICELLNNIQNETLKVRIAHELCTYASSALKYKILYKISQILIISLPLIVMFLSLGQQETNRYQALLSGMVTVIAGIASVFSFYDKWKHYRSYCEIAKQEVHKCIMELGKYEHLDSQEREKILGAEFEKIVSFEGKQWKKLDQNATNKSGTSTEQTEEN